MKPAFILLLLLVFSVAVGAEGTAASVQRKTAEVGGVAVSVTLLQPAESGSATIDFQLVMNTHRGSLPTDMLNVAKLLEKGGEVIPPLAWSGGKGGHHLKGKLSFPADRTAIGGTFTLMLQGIDGQNDLRFEWTTTGGV